MGQAKGKKNVKKIAENNNCYRKKKKKKVMCHKVLASCYGKELYSDRLIAMRWRSRRQPKARLDVDEGAGNVSANIKVDYY